MMVPVNMNGGPVIMQAPNGAMPMVQQAPMAMMQPGQPGWAPQQPPNGSHGQPQQIQHVIGTTPQMPEQQPASQPSNKAAPGRLQNKPKGLQNRPKGPSQELTNEAPEQAEKAGWGQPRKKLVNATMAHGSADQSTDVRNSKQQQSPSLAATAPEPTPAVRQPEPTPAASVAASQPQAQTVVANQTSAQPKKEEPKEEPAQEEEQEEKQEEEPKKPGEMSWADRVRAAATKPKPAPAKSKPPQKSATAPTEVKKPAEEPIAPAPVEERELPAWGPPKKAAEASKAPATGNEVPPADAESTGRPA